MGAGGGDAIPIRPLSPIEACPPKQENSDSPHQAIGAPLPYQIMTFKKLRKTTK